MRWHGVTASLLLLLRLCGPAVAQPVPDLTQPDLDLAVRRGGIATLAPLCRLRDQHWANDLREATIQDVTKSPAPDEQALKAAPGSDIASAALGYAETEALEAFAERAPEASCGTLAHGPELADADQRVATYRHDLGRATRVW